MKENDEFITLGSYPNNVFGEECEEIRLEKWKIKT